MVLVFFRRQCLHSNAPPKMTKAMTTAEQKKKGQMIQENYDVCRLNSVSRAGCVELTYWQHDVESHGGG